MGMPIRWVHRRIVDEAEARASAAAAPQEPNGSQNEQAV
jgi:hypothetical protein